MILLYRNGTSPNDEMDLSVIICTRNRERSLDRTLDACELIATSKSWELIVVDNGSADGTKEVIARRAAQNALPLVSVYEPTAGHSAARNAGLRRARGRIVCFTDDDCYPAPSFVDAWLHVFESSPLDFAGGRIELFDSSDAPVTIKTSLDAEQFAPYSYLRPGVIKGACMAFRRRVIDQIGEFDTDFGVGSRFKSGDDAEYFQRASNAGFIGGYRPEPVVAHHHGRKPSSPELRSVKWRNDVARGAFYARTLVRNPSCLVRHLRTRLARRPTLIEYVKSDHWRRTDRRRLKRSVSVIYGLWIYAVTSFVRSKRLISGFATASATEKSRPVRTAATRLRSVGRGRFFSPSSIARVPRRIRHEIWWRAKTCQSRYNFHQRPHGLSAELVVSLTSYPARFRTLSRTLNSLLRQSVKADRTVLWIAHSDFSQLPKAVTSLTGSSLEIRLCNDFRSYTKILPALDKFPGAYICTADDDLYYWPTWLEELIEGVDLSDHRIVTCHRAHQVTFDDGGGLKPYNQWVRMIQRGEESPFLFPTGCAGALYPPGILAHTPEDRDAAFTLCFDADDIWLYWVGRRNGAIYRMVGRGYGFHSWLSTRKGGLRDRNISLGGNDRQIQNMLKRYGLPDDQSLGGLRPPNAQR
jgi:glycosyltransferase involved in cell wall biosynthesis